MMSMTSVFHMNTWIATLSSLALVYVLLLGPSWLPNGSRFERSKTYLNITLAILAVIFLNMYQNGLMARLIMPRVDKR